MNFLAYLFMGIPAGNLLVSIGYKKTALYAIVVGLIIAVLRKLPFRHAPYSTPRLRPGGSRGSSPYVAREETKFGFSPDELMEYFRARRFENLKATHIYAGYSADRRYKPP